MAGQTGAAASPLNEKNEALEALEERPYAFHFYQAMRLLESVYSDSPRMGRALRLSEEPVRLGQEPSLAFAPSSLSEFQSGEDGTPHKMSVNFFGMLGPNGPLPLHLTEFANDRRRHNDDPTFAAFLDIFHHRILSLFYRAWADAQPVAHFDRRDSDRFSVYVGSLMGIGMDSLRNRDAFPDLAKLFYAGRFANASKNPDGLRDMIADFFGVPCRIEEFVGQWAEIPNQSRFYLGERPDSSTLGVGSTLGDRVWDCQQRFRITVGPLCWDDFERLLPGGESLERLTALVRNYIGDELLWDLNLVLLQGDTPSWQLGDAKTGLNMWMDNAGVNQDPRDVVLHS